MRPSCPGELRCPALPRAPGRESAGDTPTSRPGPTCEAVMEAPPMSVSDGQSRTSHGGSDGIPRVGRTRAVLRRHLCVSPARVRAVPSTGQRPGWLTSTPSNILRCIRPRLLRSGLTRFRRAGMEHSCELVCRQPRVPANRDCGIRKTGGMTAPGLPEGSPYGRAGHGMATEPAPEPSGQSAALVEASQRPMC